MKTGYHAAQRHFTQPRRTFRVGTTYSKAGVDIEAGETFVRQIRKAVRSTFTPGVLSDIGAFGAFFDANFRGLRSPVLVSSVDGVGTKLLVAKMMKKHDTVGMDLVNHCVNDILVCGARPLFFLDYFATGRLRLEVASEIIKGFAAACKENGCALVGGETAEMPGMYAEDEYDLAGTIVGVVERRRIIDGKKIRKGDVLIGLPSTGLHTNGYSLARAVFFRNHTVESYFDELGATVGEALLAVHRSYLKAVLPVLDRFEVRGLSHITGGGIVGNTMRVMPAKLRLGIDWSAWERPPLFSLIQRLGEVPEEDMRRTFNLGIGLIMIVSPLHADGLIAFLRRRRERPVIMGEVV
jgi:phosphoribosylformylglycinamidine cyclo-ligase